MVQAEHILGLDNPPQVESEEERVDRALSRVDRIKKTMVGLDDPYMRGYAMSMATRNMGKSGGDNHQDDGDNKYVDRILRIKEMDQMLQGLNIKGDKKQPNAEIEAVKKDLGEKLSGLTKSMESLSETMKNMATGKQSGLEKSISSLEGTVKELYAKAQNPNLPMDTKSVFERMRKDVDDATAVVKASGKDVVSGSISKLEAEKMFETNFKERMESMDEDAVKKWAEERGLKVSGGKISWDEVEAKIKAAKDAAVEEVIADKRMDQVTTIIGKAIDKVLDMVSPSVQEIFKSGLEERVEQNQPAAEEPKVVDSTQTGEDKSSSEQSDTAPSS